MLNISIFFLSLSPLKLGSEKQHYRKVYVPITNPSIVTDTLQKVSVECDRSSGATVNQAWVYFGKTKILNASVTSEDTGYYMSVASDNQKADSRYNERWVRP